MTDKQVYFLIFVAVIWFIAGYVVKDYTTPEPEPMALDAIDSMLICIDWAYSGKGIVAHDVVPMELEPGLFIQSDVYIRFATHIDTVLKDSTMQVEWSKRDD